MVSDPLFYRVFKELPGCFFQLVGRPESDAERYELTAIEIKSTAVRLDGLFRPLEKASGPAYLWEAQFYTSKEFYGNLITKIGRFIQHVDSDHDWVAVVIYPSRRMEQKNLYPCRMLLESKQLIRIYLDELPAPEPNQFELGVLDLIAAKPDDAMDKARAMVPRLRSSKHSVAFQRLVLQLIETVIVHQFPELSPERLKK